MAAPSAPRPPRPRKEPQPLVIPRNAAEEQRLRLERLMRNPEKTVPIPEKLNEWAPRPPPEFVRDVMGSSAGAGSGEFHVYRHLRRREYQRQDFMDAMAEKQRLDEEFQKKLERNKMIAEEQTAKRRRKRSQVWCWGLSVEPSDCVVRGTRVPDCSAWCLPLHCLSVFVR
ncbi:PRKR-interacting protein 1 isoform X3 [Centrocercus urophasianus]|uniref:PRKR-interacting protein 1 isoform X3 n=1 Tax=Centrocercus urophasianus TaxID=9002 RepID=UPI001C650E8E|nr:PRKR-interacting protein 1 isoform X3 [Centrocercus urophasianus]